MAFGKSDLLRMCCECKAIDIGNDNWMRENMNPTLYRRFLKFRGENITHGYCEECSSKLDSF
jgi:hypothetical protein